MGKLEILITDLEQATENYKSAGTIYNQNYWRDRMDSIGQEIDKIIDHGQKVVVNNPNYRD